MVTVNGETVHQCFFSRLDGVLQIKNNCTTFVSLCTILNRYYQVDGDPFIEENSATIQRIFVHAFACCVRRNAKIELDYLIKNHAIIYYDSCRSKPSDIRHNILTYCVVRNLATVFDQLMISMKTTMYKTYQNSNNPDWQPHIAWREIIHIIIDPLGNGSNDQNDFAQLACYGDTTTNFASIGSIPILHATGDEYIRCINTRKNIIAKTKRKLPRALSDANKQRPVTRRMNSFDQQQIEDALAHSFDATTTRRDGNETDRLNQNPNGHPAKRSRNIFKNVNRIRWGGGKTSDRTDTNSHSHSRTNKRNNSPMRDEHSMPADAISLVSQMTY